MFDLNDLFQPLVPLSHESLLPYLSKIIRFDKVSPPLVNL